MNLLCDCSQSAKFILIHIELDTSVYNVLEILFLTTLLLYPLLKLPVYLNEAASCISSTFFSGGPDGAV